ncbi:MAG: hypothetical protein DRI88_09085 [Bacteroidetes bacterium]|nr:MAG: hypothetical protein DRI88_09085 [Bacteroidota bacterium]
MTEVTKTDVEVLKEQLDKGYTDIGGLVVRNTWQGLEIVKLNIGFGGGQPVAMTLDVEELKKLYNLATVIDEDKKAYRHNNTANWRAEDILGKGFLTGACEAEC